MSQLRVSLLTYKKIDQKQARDIISLIWKKIVEKWPFLCLKTHVLKKICINFQKQKNLTQITKSPGVQCERIN